MTASLADPPPTREQVVELLREQWADFAETFRANGLSDHATRIEKLREALLAANHEAEVKRIASEATPLIAEGLAFVRKRLEQLRAEQERIGDELRGIDDFMRGVEKGRIIRARQTRRPRPRQRGPAGKYRRGDPPAVPGSGGDHRQCD